MKTREFTLPFGCTTFEYGVVIHPSLQALQREYYQAQMVGDGAVSAFCERLGRVVGEKLVVLHFYRGGMDTATVAHEGFHAIITLAHYFRLDLNNSTSEELMAETLERLIRDVQKAARSSKRPLAQRRRSCGLSFV